MRRATHPLIAVGLAAVAAAGTLGADQSAQSPLPDVPRYEASIRRNTTPDARPIGGQGRRPDGFVVTAARPRDLVGIAYDTFTFGRIVGLPAWTSDERYDIVAKTAGELKDLRVLLQALLRDRFAMRSHTEVRQVPSYVLSTLHADGSLGPRLKSAAVNCDDAEAVERARATKAPGAPLCNGVSGRNRIWFSGMRVGSIANALASLLNRPVIDRTGLTGRFDVDVEYAAPDVPDPADASDRVSVFTAVQEQLGLRLQPEDVPMEVLIVDSIARPTDN
jgi:uncharacterized protein (TIGR03435 family)